MNPIESYRERTRARLVGDFATFARRAWKIIEPGKELQWSWHHQLVAEHLQLSFLGEEPRLIITMPPRTLKSRLTSVLFPAWVWCQAPAKSFILVSYSDSLSEELNIIRRNLLQSEWFQQTFPGRVIFSLDQNRREQFANTAGGQMIATSTMGTLTGKGGDFLNVDDLLSPQQSYSDIERENANRFFDSTLRSRLNVPTEGSIICISQRLHELDLPGHLLANEPGVWTHVNLPMVAEVEEDVVLPLSNKVFHRAVGDLLQPGRFPKSWCDKTKAVVGPYIWAGQYMQQPGPSGGSVFRREWFRTYKQEPERGQTVIALDTAFSAKRTSDFSVATVWTAYDGKFYLRYLWRDRCEYPQLKAMTEELCQTWAPDTVLIEERGSGQSLLQSLKQETSLPIRGVQVDADKVSRAHGVTGIFSSGKVLFPEEKEASWLPTLLHELELFPASAYDDQVDSLVMALAYLRSQQTDGRLTYIDAMKTKAVDWANGIFTRKSALVKVSGQGAAVAEAKPAIVTVDQWEKFKNTQQGPPCPGCGHKNTFLQRDANAVIHIHCRQCGCVDGVDLPKPITGICPHPGCGLKLSYPSGLPYCQNHGQIEVPAPYAERPRGMSRREYNARHGGFALHTPGSEFPESECVAWMRRRR